MSKNFPYNVMRHKNWDRAPRVEAIAAFIFPSAIAAGGTAAFLATAATYIAVTAVTSWAISALSPKPDFSSFGSQGTLVNSRDATAPADFVYGQVRKGGVVTFLESHGDANKYLEQIITVAAHEVEELGDIYLNDEIVSTNSYGWVTETAWARQVNASLSDSGGIFYDSGTNANYQSYLRIEKFDGTQTTPPPLLLIRSELAGLNAITSDFVGNGISYLYVHYRYDSQIFASGLPLVTVIVKGKKVYDPRTSTTAYSNSAALCIRDFITSTYGLNDNAIDDVSFSAAANESDEDIRLSNIVDAGNFVIGQQYEIKTVGTTDFTAIGASANTVGQVFVATGVGSGTGDAYLSEKRYTINGIVKANSPTGKVLGEMSTACAGTLFWGSGYWKLKVGAYTAPVKTLTLDDLRGPINLQTRSSTRDSFNGVGGTFNNADGDFITADYPPIKSNLFKDEDGGDEMLLDLPLPFTTSASTAQRIAKMTLYRGREQMTISADFGLEAFNIEVGDIIAFDNDRYGFDGKEFEVIGWKFASNQQAGDLRVTLTLQETSEAAFDWNAEESDIINNNTNLPDFTAGLQISNLSVSQVTEMTSDGTHTVFGRLSWDVAFSAFTSYYEVQWRKTTDADYQSTTTPNTSLDTGLLIDGTGYTARVRAVTQNGYKGSFASITFTAQADTTAPGVPTSLSVNPAYRSNVLQWTNPTDRDFKEVEIYVNTSNNSGTASLLGSSAGTNFTHGGLAQSVTRYYWAKSKDFTGNLSGFSSVASGTTLADPQDSPGTDGDNGDTIITGIVYYQILQPGTPNLPSASSYNVSSASFVSLSSNWSLTQPTVSISKLADLEWSSNFTVTIDGVTSVQTIDFSTPSGAIQIANNIQSDNYSSGLSGWQIQRNTGNAEFGAASIRGTLSASQIQIDNVTLDTNASNQLIVKDGGVGTDQIAANAISQIGYQNFTNSNYTVFNAQTLNTRVVEFTFATVAGVAVEFEYNLVFNAYAHSVGQGRLSSTTGNGFEVRARAAIAYNASLPSSFYFFGPEQRYFAQKHNVTFAPLISATGTVILPAGNAQNHSSAKFSVYIAQSIRDTSGNLDTYWDEGQVTGTLKARYIKR